MLQSLNIGENEYKEYNLLFEESWLKKDWVGGTLL